MARPLVAYLDHMLLVCLSLYILFSTFHKNQKFWGRSLYITVCKKTRNSIEAALCEDSDQEERQLTVAPLQISKRRFQVEHTKKFAHQLSNFRQSSPTFTSRAITMVSVAAKSIFVALALRRDWPRSVKVSIDLGMVIPLPA